jgi:hypothetical protein
VDRLAPYPQRRTLRRACKLAVAGSRDFGRARALDAGVASKTDEARIAISPTSDGGAVVAWNAALAAPLRLAIAGADGRYARRETLAADGELKDLEVAPQTGMILAVWTVSPFPGDGFGTVFGAFRPLAGSFGVPESIFGPAVVAAAATFDSTGTGVTVALTTYVSSQEELLGVGLADRP